MTVEDQGPAAGQVRYWWLQVREAARAAL